MRGSSEKTTVGPMQSRRFVIMISSWLPIWKVARASIQFFTAIQKFCTGETIGGIKQYDGSDGALLNMKSEPPGCPEPK
jgi:hypothetical protein